MFHICAIDSLGFYHLRMEFSPCCFVPAGCTALITGNLLEYFSGPSAAFSTRLRHCFLFALEE